MGPCPTGKLQHVYSEVQLQLGIFKRPYSMVCSWIISMCGLFAAHSSLATCENLYTLSKYTNRLLCLEGCQILYALSLSTLVAREYLFYGLV